MQVVTLRAGEEPGLAARAERLLSGAELERAGRIRVAGARDEFVVGRAALRVLMGKALDLDPRTLPLRVDAFGKPCVPGGVHSNVSHSRGLIYVALCREAAVGVDVEWIDAGLEALDLAEANFTSPEAANIASEPAGMDRARAFCRIWTRKEAVAKAAGLGLRIPLRHIAVPDELSGTATVRFGEEVTTGGAPAAAEYFVSELAAPPGFAAALAIHGLALPVRIL